MIVDLFAGPGGWDEGLRMLGRHKNCVGFEWDEAACQTAEAAGHRRHKADIAALDPFLVCPGTVEGLIASPPCQSFSTAGKQLGRADKPYVIQCAHELAAGFDSRHQYAHLLKDERSLLTVEPLRWALALRPRWIAFEQVPAVLELWTLFAGLLTERGYHATAGVLTAEQYGVPQTRKRAYLVASLDGPVSLPEPTHSKYYGRDPQRLDPGLLPWVSMARALGWGTTERPAYTRSDLFKWVTHYNPRQRTAAPRPVTEPAPTITSALGKGVARWDTDAGEIRDGTALAPQRVTVEEATTLMGFRPDYPWQGSRSKQFEQLGNAVCPPVGARVLAEAMRLDASLAA